MPTLNKCVVCALVCVGVFGMLGKPDCYVRVPFLRFSGDLREVVEASAGTLAALESPA